MLIRISHLMVYSLSGAHIFYWLAPTLLLVLIISLYIKLTTIDDRFNNYTYFN